MSNAVTPSQSRRGYSAMETIIVCTVTTILASVAVPRIAGTVDKGRQAATVAALSSLATSLDDYKLEFGSYPPNLAALVPQFIPLPEAIPTDGWGNSFQYSLTANGYLLESFGRDGQDGPAPSSPWRLGTNPEGDIEMNSGYFVRRPL